MANLLVTVKETDWRGNPLTIKGRNQGVQEIIAEYIGETYNIVDFLNHTLLFDYRLAYDKILDKYENLMQTGNILECGYPEIETPCLPLQKTAYESENYPTDTALVEALLKEYEKNYREMEQNIARWDTVMQAWYTRIHSNPDNPKPALSKE